MRAVLKFCRHLVTAGSDITEAKCSGSVFVKNKIVVKNQTLFLWQKSYFLAFTSLFIIHKLELKILSKSILAVFKNMSAMSTALTISTLSSKPDISILNNHFYSKLVWPKWKREKIKTQNMTFPRCLFSGGSDSTDGGWWRKQADDDAAWTSSWFPPGGTELDIVVLL